MVIAIDHLCLEILLRLGNGLFSLSVTTKSVAPNPLQFPFFGPLANDLITLRDCMFFSKSAAVGLSCVPPR